MLIKTSTLSWRTTHYAEQGTQTGFAPLSFRRQKHFDMSRCTCRRMAVQVEGKIQRRYSLKLILCRRPCSCKLLLISLFTTEQAKLKLLCRSRSTEQVAARSPSSFGRAACKLLRTVGSPRASLSDLLIHEWGPADIPTTSHSAGCGLHMPIQSSKMERLLPGKQDFQQHEPDNAITTSLNNDVPHYLSTPITEVFDWLFRMREPAKSLCYSLCHLTSHLALVARHIKSAGTQYLSCRQLSVTCQDYD